MIATDKILHFSVCLGIALILYPVIGWWSVGTALATGVLKELWDWRDYGNFSWGDILADTVGTAAGALLIMTIKLIIQ